jgi:hypothetical protein
MEETHKVILFSRQRHRQTNNLYQAEIGRHIRYTLHKAETERHVHQTETYRPMTDRPIQQAETDRKACMTYPIAGDRQSTNRARDRQTDKHFSLQQTDIQTNTQKHKRITYSSLRQLFPFLPMLWRIRDFIKASLLKSSVKCGVKSQSISTRHSRIIFMHFFAAPALQHCFCARGTIQYEFRDASKQGKQSKLNFFQ